MWEQIEKYLPEFPSAVHLRGGSADQIRDRKGAKDADHVQAEDDQERPLHEGHDDLNERPQRGRAHVAGGFDDRILNLAQAGREDKNCGACRSLPAQGRNGIYGFEFPVKEIAQRRR